MAKQIKGINKLIKARSSLLLADAAYGVPALGLSLVPVENHPVIWAMGTDGKHLFFNPDWVEATPLDEIKGVIVHEVWHIWSKHDIRKGARDHMRFNMACVTGDSLVIMVDGTKKPIKHVVTGDLVIGERNGVLSPSRVLTTMCKYDTVMEVKLHSDKRLICTPSHRILTQRGYIACEELREEETAYLVGERGKIHFTESQFYEYNGDGRGPWDYGKAGGQLSIQPRSLREEDYTEKAEHQSVRGFDERTAGLHGRYCRWGRNSLNSENIQRLLPSTSRGQQYELCPGGVDEQVGFLWSYRKEFGRKPVLEISHEWVSRGRYSEAAAALFDNQEAARTTGYPIHRDSSVSAFQSKADGRDEEYPCRDQRFEQERISSIRRLEETRLVFDLATTTHSYIANDIVVHNCDYAINPIIRASDKYPVIYRLPANTLDSRYAGDAAELIYTKLPGGVGSGAGAGTGTSWDVGDVQTNADMAKGQSPQDVEANRDVQISNWYQNAKRAGRVPAELERIVGEMMKTRLPWREIMARFVNTHAANDYDHTICDPEYARYSVYMPSVRSEELGLIAYIGDTSGSINPKQHTFVVSEMQGLLRAFDNSELLAMWVDHALHNPEYIRADDIPLNIHPVGGGGTSFRPGFDYLREQEIMPKCVVYATDGYCDDFPDDPGIPVLWLVITKNEEFHPPFGEVCLCDFE